MRFISLSRTCISLAYVYFYPANIWGIFYFWLTPFHKGRPSTDLWFVHRFLSADVFIFVIKVLYKDNKKKPMMFNNFTQNELRLFVFVPNHSCNFFYLVCPKEKHNCENNMAGNELFYAKNPPYIKTCMLVHSPDCIIASVITCTVHVIYHSTKY